ncbi:MAG: acyl-CoA dehydrogenase family protein [Acidimicrobiia bacterium]
MAERFARTDEQQMLSSTLRELLGETADMDRTRELSLTTDAFDRDTWTALSEMGLVGLTLDEQHGGAGLSFADTGVVFEELGRAVAAVPLLSNLLAMSMIDGLGSDAQRRELLPPIASGASIATLAVHETPHETGAPLDTTAGQGGDGWHVAGTKRFVTDAPNADVFVVVATSPEGPAAFVVPSDADGVSVEASSALDATRPLGEVSFDTRVPESARLGDGDVEQVLAAALDRGVVALANEQVGGAQRCLEASVEYAGERFQFGRAIGSFQAVKHLCADMLVAVEHARSVAWHAATTIDDAEESQVAVPLARSVCSDAYLFAAGANIQIHGGIGFTWEHDAHLYFKRAKSTSLILGSVDSYRDRLADAIGI